MDHSQDDVEQKTNLHRAVTAFIADYVIHYSTVEVDIDIPLSSHHWGEQVLYYYYLFV